MPPKPVYFYLKHLSASVNSQSHIDMHRKNFDSVLNKACEENLCLDSGM